MLYDIAKKERFVANCNADRFLVCPQEKIIAWDCWIWFYTGKVKNSGPEDYTLICP